VPGRKNSCPWSKTPRTPDQGTSFAETGGHRTEPYLKPPLHLATVIVQWLDPDLGLAHCSDERGSRYTIDRRSAVSISALREGLPLRVKATTGRVVKFLVLDERRTPAGDRS